MKKMLLLISFIAMIASTCIGTSVFPAMATSDETVMTKDYRAIFLMDYDTGTVLLEENADSPYPIASMVKIMTLAIAFNEIEKGNLAFDEKITVSEYAAGMGGSQLFLDANEEYPVNDLIKGVIVCSANDAATALGERISGSIDTFVSHMNAYAKELGMKNTVFCNATGLPNSGEQHSTARDVSIMMRKVLSYPDYYRFSKIWMEEYEHPDGRKTEIVNTNKLIRFMKECDGGKTGFTNEAGFCLSATAKMGETRVIATLLGASDGKARFREVSELLQYGLTNYETKVYMHKDEIVKTDISDIKGAKEEFAELYCDRDIRTFGKKNSEEMSAKIILFDDLKAPIDKDESIGIIELYNDKGEKVYEANLRTKHRIERRKIGDYIKDIIQNRYFKK